MAARDTVQVIPNLLGGWSVKRYGALRASRNFATRDEAIDWGRDQSRKRRSELYIHGKDGAVQRKVPYRNQDEISPLPG